MRVEDDRGAAGLRVELALLRDARSLGACSGAGGEQAFGSPLAPQSYFRMLHVVGLYFQAGANATDTGTESETDRR